MSFGKDGKGIIVKEQTTITLGGLAGQAAVLINALQLDNDFRILKTDLTCVLTGLTTGEGNGLLLYMTQGDLTVTDVEANIELSGPLSPGDRPSIEIADRWVRRLGAMDGEAVSTERMMHNEGDGPLLTINPRWTFRRRRTATEGGWNWVIYNDGVTITTGATARLIATHYGVWVT